MSVAPRQPWKRGEVTLSVGVISDTHGLLRPEAITALHGSETILHAGDIGGPEVLDALHRIAPVTAVRGNVDHAPWAMSLPESATLVLGGLRLHVVHDLQSLLLDPVTEGYAAVVVGHSHRPMNRLESDVLFFNPGSAGPRRYRLAPSVGRLMISGGAVRGEILRLDAS